MPIIISILCITHLLFHTWKKRKHLIWSTNTALQPYGVHVCRDYLKQSQRIDSSLNWLGSIHFFLTSFIFMFIFWLFEMSCCYVVPEDFALTACSGLELKAILLPLHHYHATRFPFLLVYFILLCISHNNWGDRRYLQRSPQKVCFGMQIYTVVANSFWLCPGQGWCK